ncbi:LysR substrate-binding domain-containing protein, partial [Pseudomonas sp. FSL R10-1339]|uniref:LysR substrate-binding domain-containing protein n=1 Tax=Pseudomonas sp. FSL R10-1339 TaxID=2662196 RepID=UPI001295A848
AEQRQLAVDLVEAWGEHLLQVIAPRFDEINSELALLSKFRDRPAGKLRITAGEHAAIAVLQPVLARLLPDHPDLSIEIIVDYGLTDIVAEGFDAGVRLGEQVAKDMIAMRIGPDMRMAVIGSPAYFSHYPKPVIPADLMAHNCITLRMPTHGGLFMWEFEKYGQALNVRIEGQLVFNNIAMRLESVLQGLGLAYMPEDVVRPYIEQGRLIRVLEDWCEPYSGYHLYYPSRRQSSPAFTLLREALRYPG